MGYKVTRESITTELNMVLENKEIVTQRISVQDAWFILMACQLTYMHPFVGEQIKNVMLVLGRRMQELIAPFVSLAFREFMEAGWNREFDE